MLFVLSALFATFGSLHAEVTCPPDSIPGPDTCYKLGPAPMSWYMARHQCALLGGQLGVVDNAQVNNIVSQLAGSGSAKDYWTAAVHSDHWVWDPKDIPLTYTNWKQGTLLRGHAVQSCRDIRVNLSYDPIFAKDPNFPHFGCCTF